jgi:hypothetical protein
MDTFQVSDIESAKNTLRLQVRAMRQRLIWRECSFIECWRVIRDANKLLDAVDILEKCDASRK